LEALGINLPGFLSQIISFLIVLFIVSRFTPRILNALDERARKIKEGLEAAERDRQEAQQAQANRQVQLDSALKEGQAIIEQASKAAEQVRQEILAEAHKESEAMLARARAEFQLERDKALQELRSQFADLTIVAAEKVINESLDKDRHERLIQNVLEESRLN
jgi:F-type H+-transporting ATPase subunit b